MGRDAMNINPNQSTAAPTNPYHIARAYGIQTTPPVRPVQAAPTSRQVAEDPGAETVQRLVAGVVPGGVAFDAAGVPQPASAALPMYRHPADKNAAATAVQVGRRLDTTA